MLDVMSGGRLRVAFPLGTGMEYWANAVNPATARARFRESLDIILKCWTEDGPIATRASSTRTAISIRGRSRCSSRTPSATSSAPDRRRRSSWPPSSASATRWCSSRRRCSCRCSTTTGSGSSTTATTRPPDKVTIGPVLAYVADTDEQAEEEFRPHVMYFFENALRTTPRYLNPPGYVTVPEFRKRIQAADVHGSANWDDLIALNRIVAGTPEKVADAIGRWIEEAGSSRVNLNLTIGDMPNWKVVQEHDALRRRSPALCVPRPRRPGTAPRWRPSLASAMSDATLTFERLTTSTAPRRSCSPPAIRARHRSCSSTAPARSTGGRSPSRGRRPPRARAVPPRLRRVRRPARAPRGARPRAALHRALRRARAHPRRRPGRVLARRPARGPTGDRAEAPPAPARAGRARRACACRASTSTTSSASRRRS